MFDPYKKWLGIQSKDQPPNHYRLLSLDNFESDLDVIEGAADRQMGFIRQYQSGEYAAFAAKLLNEIAAARLCLLKPATKAEYDAKLKKQLIVPVTTDDEFPSFDADAEIAEMMKAPKLPKLERKQKRKKSKSPEHLWIAVGIGAVVCVLAVVLMNSSSAPSINLSEASTNLVAQSTPTSALMPSPTIASSQTAKPPSTTAALPTISVPPTTFPVDESQNPTQMAEEVTPAPKKAARMPSQMKITKSSEKSIESSELVGGTGGIPFSRDLNGKAMVGVIWSAGNWANSKVISNIVPVAVGTGSPGSFGELVVAPKGYAVGGIKICAPKFVSHVQLIYMKKNDDGTLDPSTTKLSKWLGGNPKGEIIEISGEGKKVVGLTGRAAAVLDALGVLFETEE